MPITFDGRTLLRIPHVKMLHLDSLVQAYHTETLAVLEHLCSLHLGIWVYMS